MATAAKKTAAKATARKSIAQDPRESAAAPPAAAPAAQPRVAVDTAKADATAEAVKPFLPPMATQRARIEEDGPTEPTVAVVVPKRFKLITDDHKETVYEPGFYDMPVSHANHWYTKACGVKAKG